MRQTDRQNRPLYPFWKRAKRNEPHFFHFFFSFVIFLSRVKNTPSSGSSRTRPGLQAQPLPAPGQIPHVGSIHGISRILFDSKSMADDSHRSCHHAKWIRRTTNPKAYISIATYLQFQLSFARFQCRLAFAFA